MHSPPVAQIEALFREHWDEWSLFTSPTWNQNEPISDENWSEMLGALALSKAVQRHADGSISFNNSAPLKLVDAFTVNYKLREISPTIEMLIRLLMLVMIPAGLPQQTLAEPGSFAEREENADVIERTVNARVKSVAGGFAALQFMHPNEAYGKVTIQLELAGDLAKAMPGQRVKVKLSLNKEHQIIGFLGVEVDQQQPSAEEFLAYDDTLSAMPPYPDDPDDTEQMRSYDERMAEFLTRRHEARRKLLITGDL